MRHKILLSLCAIVLLGTGLRSETKKESPVTEVNVNQVTLSPEMIRYAVTAERRAIFTAALEDLLKDPTVKSNFWDVYNAYKKEREGVMDSRMNLVAEYAKNFTTMSDSKVKELLKSSYKNQSKELAIRKKYAAQISKKVNATVAGRFWQVDDFITSAIKVSLLSSVPLLGEEIK
ncbi:MAG: hypothetical protein IPN19_01165 [Elusimicrobia bacterium]|nr:hypothetical protein [Elusimicrobiota bacterium]